MSTFEHQSARGWAAKVYRRQRKQIHIHAQWITACRTQSLKHVIGLIHAQTTRGGTLYALAHRFKRFGCFSIVCSRSRHLYRMPDDRYSVQTQQSHFRRFENRTTTLYLGTARLLRADLHSAVQVEQPLQKKEAAASPHRGKLYRAT